MIGLKFDSGVLIAADTLISYGSLARFRSVQRVVKINDQTIAGASGDYADFQFLHQLMEQKQIEEECFADGHTLTPKGLHSWLTRVQYNRRSKFDPLWTTWLIGGLQDGVPYLGQADMLGTAFTDNAIATGYGAYIALPVLRKRLDENPVLSEAEALKLIEDVMKILYSRDARSLPQYQVAIVKKDGAKITGPFEIDADWTLAHYPGGTE